MRILLPAILILATASVPVANATTATCTYDGTNLGATTSANQFRVVDMNPSTNSGTREVRMIQAAQNPLTGQYSGDEIVLASCDKITGPSAAELADVVADASIVQYEALQLRISPGATLYIVEYTDYDGSAFRFLNDTATSILCAHSTPSFKPGILPHQVYPNGVSGATIWDVIVGVYDASAGGWTGTTSKLVCP